ncbi:MAG TPA: matrixin family metalloprotease, partial [Candidatus Anammoximicrobium sp.]|nr:matrixin family metalloprotease [Candidatus Anammoximicrobium sp.]
EGASYLATDTYAAAVAQTSRTVTLAVSGLSVNQRIVATATDALGNTSEFSASVVVASSLLAPAEVQRESSSATLDAAELGALVWQAIAAWESAGLDAAGVAALQSLSFEVTDLPGRYLGLASRDRIVLDLDAAGFGWYVADASGEVSDEFEISNLKSQMDLLTAMMHEMGHVLGLADLDGEDDLMAAVLQPGTRRLPTLADVDQVLASGDWLEGPADSGGY